MNYSTSTKVKPASRTRRTVVMRSPASTFNGIRIARDDVQAPVAHAVLRNLLILGGKGYAPVTLVLTPET